VSRRLPYAALAAICAVPRLAVLLHERGAITAAFTEKSDTFAQMFVAHGTYGMLPGQPSAYTQPLYGWVLIPVYWIFGRGWLSIGLAQIALAVAVAWLVFEIGRRVLGPRAGFAAALIATLNPYLVWHDVHVNREIVDEVCAAALVLLTLVVAERPSKRLAAVLGVVTGLAMLGNTRLVFLPILCAAYIAWRLPRARATAGIAALVLAGAAVAVTPWIVRNRVGVGCWAITTDGRALWKANNPQTYGLLSSGQWIDNVRRNSPRPAGAGYYTPEEALGYYVATHGKKVIHPDECLEMRFYQHLAVEWVKHHPGTKLKLAALSEQLLWQPSVIETGGGSHQDAGRRILEPAYMLALYALAAAGLFVGPHAFVALALLLLAYQSASAAVFVGATRYRVAWDFLIVLLAAAALARAAAWTRDRRSRPGPTQAT
jgi:4-amino-4-deoxy-L-arabinose transferase-like glycosyltransferase